MKKGLVFKSTGSWYTIRDESGVFFDCRIKGKLRTLDIKCTNPVSVGDWVLFETTGNEKTGVITEVCERKNYIIRKSSNLSKQKHIIAANIDQAFLMVTLALPVTTTTFIDRFLVSAEAYRIPVIILFNKADIYTDEAFVEQLQDVKKIYESIGYYCLETSATKKINLEKVKELMKDKISVVSGHSGVGKSTLINAIDSKLNLKIGEISSAHFKGKHTTTFAEMFELTSGGYIIDTPGIKGFGLIDFYKEEIYHFFPEMFRLAPQCQYYNCTHTHEPNCAIKKGVENGVVHESRYISYLSLLEGDDEKYRSGMGR